METDYEEIVLQLERISGIIHKYPESLQSRVFDILVNSYFNNGKIDYTPSAIHTEKAVVNSDEEKEQPLKELTPQEKSLPLEKQKNKPKLVRRPPSYNFNKELDLSSKSNSISLKDYVANYNVKTDIDFNTISIYYLRHIKHYQEEINVDHIYTCYKYAERKLPADLKGSLKNTADRRYGYIDQKGGKNITLTSYGENHVEFKMKIKGAS
jgi:hypothetical protein